MVSNHPSWWDPLVGLALTEFMHERRIHYCPIDVNGLTQYPFLERLGFFGVEVGTTRGSLAFLRQASLSCLALNRSYGSRLRANLSILANDLSASNKVSATWPFGSPL